MTTRTWLPWAASIPAMPLVGFCLWLYALPEFRESYGFALVIGFSVLVAMGTFGIIAVTLHEDEQRSRQ